MTLADYMHLHPWLMALWWFGGIAVAGSLFSNGMANLSTLSGKLRIIVEREEKNP